MGKRKTWFMSFIITVTLVLAAIFLFMRYMKDNTALPQKSEPGSDTDQKPIAQKYTEPQDNVGDITFTEDQITELARNIFSLDGYLNDITVDIGEDGISFSAKIKDKEKLVTTYPELKKYNSVLSLIENKKISVKGNITDNDGRAGIDIQTVTVGSLPIDGNIISPFIEEGDFSELFNVNYQDIELTDSTVVFKNGVPDILKN